MPNYRIKHSQVGPFPQGRVVSHETLHEIPGFDLQRHLKCGSLERVEEPASTEPLLTSPENPPKIDSSGSPQTKIAESDGEPENEELNQETPPEEEEELPPDYNSMRKSDLATLAQQRGITGAETMKKDELVAALEEDDANNETAD